MPSLYRKEKSGKNSFVSGFFPDFLRTLIRQFFFACFMPILLLETDVFQSGLSVFLRVAYLDYSPY